MQPYSALFNRQGGGMLSSQTELVHPPRPRLDQTRIGRCSKGIASCIKGIVYSSTGTGFCSTRIGPCSTGVGCVVKESALSTSIGFCNKEVGFCSCSKDSALEFKNRVCGTGIGECKIRLCKGIGSVVKEWISVVHESLPW